MQATQTTPRTRLREKLFAEPAQAIRGLLYHYASLAYDRWYGIETRKRDVAVRYDPTEPQYIRWALHNLPIDPKNFSFVDFGSGKGRVLIAAAQLPFKQVIGVEYAKELHEAALKNISSAKRLKCKSVSSCHMDAVDFHIPDSSCVLFFYNPFRGETMERVLSNIGASLRSTPPRKFSWCM